jgi:hypothetical protein
MDRERPPWQAGDADMGVPERRWDSERVYLGKQRMS